MRLLILRMSDISIACAVFHCFGFCFLKEGVAMLAHVGLEPTLIILPQAPE